MNNAFTPVMFEFYFGSQIPIGFLQQLYTRVEGFLDKNSETAVLSVKGEHVINNPIPAVRLIVTDKKQRVLILKRACTSHGKGQWCLPGGKIDYCETVAEAAEKELEEETSLNCISLEFLFYQDSLPAKSGEMHCINFYLACKVKGEIILNEESSEYTWVDQETISDYDIIFRNREGILRYWSKSL